MRKEWLGSLAALFVGAGLGPAQPAPEPPVLASPAPNAHVSHTQATLPAELPPLTDSPTATSASPSLFPLPGSGLCEAVDGCVEELPPYYEPAHKAPDNAGRHGNCDKAHCQVWVSADPLLWWVRPGGTSPLTDGSLDYGMQVGGRVAVGFVNAAGDLGLEGAGLFFGRGTARQAATIIVPVSPRGGLVVGARAASSTQLWGAEANVVGNAYGSGRLGIDLVGGLRYLTLDEALGGSIEAPAIFAASDALRARNQFFGGQFGSQVELRWGRLYTNLLGKVAVGAMHQVVDAHGDATLAGAAPLPAGLLPSASLAGRLTRDEFGVVPEVNFNVGYQFRPGIRLYAGYTFLYLNDAARPGDQIGTLLNASLLPGGLPFATTPATPLNRTDFWAQGVNFGLAVRY